VQRHADPGRSSTLRPRFGGEGRLSGEGTRKRIGGERKGDQEWTDVTGVGVGIVRLVSLILDEQTAQQ
jgi:hypothetical protein